MRIHVGVLAAAMCAMPGCFPPLGFDRAATVGKGRAEMHAPSRVIIVRSESETEVEAVPIEAYGVSFIDVFFYYGLQEWFDAGLFLGAQSGAVGLNTKLRLLDGPIQVSVAPSAWTWFTSKHAKGGKVAGLIGVPVGARSAVLLNGFVGRIYGDDGDANVGGGAAGIEVRLSRGIVLRPMLEVASYRVIDGDDASLVIMPMFGVGWAPRPGDL